MRLFLTMPALMATIMATANAVMPAAGSFMYCMQQCDCSASPEKENEIQQELKDRKKTECKKHCINNEKNGYVMYQVAQAQDWKASKNWPQVCKESYNTLKTKSYSKITEEKFDHFCASIWKNTPINMCMGKTDMKDSPEWIKKINHTKDGKFRMDLVDDTMTIEKMEKEYTPKHIVEKSMPNIATSSMHSNDTKTAPNCHQTPQCKASMGLLEKAMTEVTKNCESK